jgi:hypothetical protein
MEAKDMEIAALRLECDDVKAQASNAAVDGRAKIDALEVKAAAYEEKVAALTMCQETVEDVKMHAAGRGAVCRGRDAAQDARGGHHPRVREGKGGVLVPVIWFASLVCRECKTPISDIFRELSSRV